MGGQILILAFYKFRWCGKSVSETFSLENHLLVCNSGKMTVLSKREMAVFIN